MLQPVYAGAPGLVRWTGQWLLAAFTHAGNSLSPACPPPGAVFRFSSLSAFIIALPYCLPEHQWPPATLCRSPGWGSGVGVGISILPSRTAQPVWSPESTPQVRQAGWLGTEWLRAQWQASASSQGAEWVYLTPTPPPTASLPLRTRSLSALGVTPQAGAQMLG